MGSHFSFFQRFYFPDFYAPFSVSFPTLSKHLTWACTIMGKMADMLKVVETSNNLLFIPKTQSPFLFSCYFYWKP